MAYNVKIMPVKVCDGYWEVMIARAQNGVTGFAPTNAGGCAFSDVAEGVRYAADNGAKVMNISLGGGSTSITLRDALAYAVGKGAFIAISMGNGFETGNVTTTRRAAPRTSTARCRSRPSRRTHEAYYSSTGVHCEIAAPGRDSRQGVGTTDRGLIWQSALSLATCRPS
jgi:serine protease